MGVQFVNQEYDYKQLLLDEVFVISRIIKLEVGVISLSPWLRPSASADNPY